MWLLEMEMIGKGDRKPKNNRKYYITVSLNWKATINIQEKKFLNNI